MESNNNIKTTCDICLEDGKQVFGICKQEQHTACLQCINAVCEQSQNAYIRCPFCRQVNEICQWNTYMSKEVKRGSIMLIYVNAISDIPILFSKVKSKVSYARSMSAKDKEQYYDDVTETILDVMYSSLIQVQNYKGKKITDFIPEVMNIYGRHEKYKATVKYDRQENQITVKFNVNKEYEAE